MTMATLTSQDDDLVEFMDILTLERESSVIIEYARADDSICGIELGFAYDEQCTYEIRNFVEPTGEHNETEFDYPEVVHEGQTARITCIIRTTEGEFPLTIYQHGKSSYDHIASWRSNGANSAWESIL